MARRATLAELVIGHRVRALVRALPGARKGDVVLVHQARVATRRLREALPLVLPGARGRKFERKVRRLTRALGPVRELDVVTQTLEELQAGGEVPSSGVSRLRQAIQQERQGLHAEMCRRVDRVDVDKLRRRLAAAARKRCAAPVTGRTRDPERIAAARQRAARRAARLRAAVANAAGIYLPDRLHEVRVAVKKLRYALEVSGELSGSRATARIHMLRQVQDLLGRMHDLEVLIARVRGVQGSSRAPNLRVSGDLDRLVRHLETECRQIHGHYVTLRRKLIAICDHVERAQFRRGTGASVSSAA